MVLEWVKTLGPILISWPVVGLIAILIFRRPLLALAARFTGDDVQRIRVGSVELERVRVAVDQVQRQQALQASEIRAIHIALKGVLTSHEIGLLERLEGAGPVLIRWEPELYRYVHRLDGLNFIQPNPGYGLFTIEARHRDDEKLPVPPHERPLFDLKEFVYITDDGKWYLSTLRTILENVEQDARGSGAGNRRS